MVNSAAPAKPWDQRLAARLVRPLARTPVTPNMITTGSLLLGLLSALGFATGHAGLAGLAFMLAVFSDHADGELARLTGRTSRFGHLYDRAVAAVTYVATFIGIGLGVFRDTGQDWAIAAGIVAGLAVAAIFTLLSLGERRVREDFADQPGLAGFEVEDILYLVGPIAWLGLLDGFLVLAGFGAPLYLAWVVAKLRRDSRRA